MVDSIFEMLLSDKFILYANSLIESKTTIFFLIVVIDIGKMFSFISENLIISLCKLISDVESLSPLTASVVLLLMSNAISLVLILRGPFAMLSFKVCLLSGSPVIDETGDAFLFW